MPHAPRRRSTRLTGRGRLALLTAGLFAAVAVAAAVVLLRPDDGESPRDLGSLTVPEGRRATQVYALADQAIGLDAGTTRQAAKDTRLDQDRALEMDSTLNYALGRTSLDTTHEETRTDSPYNTYARRGLPPTPIGNPGEQALRAALDPPAGEWLYFVTVRPGDTRFSEDYAEHRAHVEEFNRERAAGGGG